MPRIYNYNELSGEWEKSDGTLVGVLSGEGRAVESVNGKTGKVNLTAEDVKALSENSVVPAITDMTEPVGIDEDGKLKTFANLHAKLLWKNASPTSRFPSQTISVDTTGFDYLIVFCARNLEAVPGYNEVYIGSCNAGDSLILSNTYGSESTIKADYRRLTIVSNIAIEFSSGYNTTYNADYTNEHIQVPLRIYGLKMGGD